MNAEKVRELFDLDAESGVLTWKANRLRGKRAGGLMAHGYRRVRVMDRVWLEHRLIWAYVYGRWPAGMLDHINGVRSDNRPCNLREGNISQNMHNQHRPTAQNKSSGLLGVTATPPGRGKRPWRAQIVIKGKKTYLGEFRTPEEAHGAYMKAKAERDAEAWGMGGEKKLTRKPKK